jgi:hypothetical protein
MWWVVCRITSTDDSQSPSGLTPRFMGERKEEKVDVEDECEMGILNS